jgi:hypothetical protein
MLSERTRVRCCSRRQEKSTLGAVLLLTKRRNRALSRKVRTERHIVASFHLI